MPRSKRPRGKKYRPAPAYGNRVVAPKPRWMRIVRLIAIILFSTLMLLAIAGMIVHKVRHMSH